MAAVSIVCPWGINEIEKRVIAGLRIEDGEVAFCPIRPISPVRLDELLESIDTFPDRSVVVRDNSLQLFSLPTQKVFSVLLYCQSGYFEHQPILMAVCEGGASRPIQTCWRNPELMFYGQVVEDWPEYQAQA